MQTPPNDILHFDDDASVTSVGSYQSAAKTKLKVAVDLFLKRVPSSSSLLSGLTLIDDVPDYKPSHEAAQIPIDPKLGAHGHARPHISRALRCMWNTCILILQYSIDTILILVFLITILGWLLGATQAFSQWLNILTGWAVLRATQPRDPGYAVPLQAVMRQGAVGGAVLHSALMFTVFGFAALGMWCDGECGSGADAHHRNGVDARGCAWPDMPCRCGRHSAQARDYGARSAGAGTRREGAVDGPPCMMDDVPLVKQLGAVASGAPIALARAAIAGLVGQAIMGHATLAGMDGTHAVRAHVVGAAILLVPRAMVVFIARIVFVRDERRRAVARRELGRETVTNGPSRV